MTSKNSIIRQDDETFDKLILVRSGQASQGAASRPGLVTFVFDDENGRDICEFNWISSVLYIDELLATKSNYPYPLKADGGSGLYECVESSYLDRLRHDEWVSGGTFRKHRHFVYWDIEFLWHITCKSITFNDVER